jgi:tetratricopeptide (TPR) repeat protein
MLSWFDSSEATGVGAALAEDVSSTATIRMRGTDHSSSQQDSKDLRRFLKKVDSDARALRLNLYKKAMLASSFRAKLLENGIESTLAEHLTQLLLTRLASQERIASDSEARMRAAHKRADFRKSDELLAEAHEFAKRGQYRQAIDAYQQVVQQMPGNVHGLQGLGTAQWKLGAYTEAEKHLRRALEVQPGNSDALCNLGAALYLRGEYTEAEIVLRRAIKSKPAFIQAQRQLANVLIMLARMNEAESLITKVLRSAPRDADALVCMGRIMRFNGRFDEARELFMRALESKPRLAVALAEMVSVRRMTAADSGWLHAVEEILAGSLESHEEAELRFAAGKYFDDVGQYEKAFRSYQRANLLMRKLAPRYDSLAREAAVSDLMRSYSTQSLPSTRTGFASSNPVFVVGMMRSGTSLVEQIIATHPRATGAGELTFWNDAYRDNETDIRAGKLSESVRRSLGERYLKLLRTHGADTKLVVDKANVNVDYMGLIHMVFPMARFICVERNPIDTCLSCYFQSLSPSHAYKFDLSELAHYYRQYQRLLRHWKSVLPSAAILEVPYEQLVSHKELWIRKILEFAGLDWQPQCLNFNQTNRPVKTASAWQVRQKMYSSSVSRWRHYEKYLGPLRGLTPHR